MFKNVATITLVTLNDLLGMWMVAPFLCPAAAVTLDSPQPAF